MSEIFEYIILQLNNLSDEQKKRLLLCIKRDESLSICLGLEKNWIIDNLARIDDIITGQASMFCLMIRENDDFAKMVRSNIFRILAPDDHILDFIDYRMENWPEE